MLISQALRIQTKEIVAFTGGGGKTTAMFRLADELAAQGKRVVTTTTTRVFAAQIKLAPYHLTHLTTHPQPPPPYPDVPSGEGRGGKGEWGEALRAALAEHPHILVTGATTAEGKALGIAPELVDEIAAMDKVDAVLYEADGARMRPFKAPAEHEPVLAAATTLLVPVVGSHALGKPLDEKHVHRAELAARLAGARLGEPVTPLLIARVLASERGGLKNKPVLARTCALVNQVENTAELPAAREIARLLLGYAEIDGVAIGAARDAANPIRETQRRVAAIVTAAGAGARLEGHIKQLLEWRGETLIENALDIAMRADVQERVLVLGAHFPEIRARVEHRPALWRGRGWRVVYNPGWEEGHASSIRAGLATLSPNTDAAIFINADQPFLTPETLDALIQRYRESDAPIVRAVYAGKPGSPALFQRAYFDELSALEGEEGGRAIIARNAETVAHVEFEDARLGFDVDTLKEYEQASAWL